MKTAALALTAILLTAAPALADEAGGGTSPELFTGEVCIPLDGMMDTVRKVQKLDADKRDRVQLLLSVGFEMEDGEQPPERVEIRAGETAETLPLNANHRTEKNTAELLSLPTGSQLCIMDPAREGRHMSALGVATQLSMRVGYIDTPGTHDLAGIKDGLKDGRSHYKKMAGAMGFMVPKFTHIAVSGNDEGKPPRVVAVRGDADLGEPEFELYDGARLIPFKALEAMGADGVRVEGEYRMSPSPDAKTVAKFAGG